MTLKLKRILSQWLITLATGTGTVTSTMKASFCTQNGRDYLTLSLSIAVLMLNLQRYLFDI
jgi:hypothetical protein